MSCDNVYTNNIPLGLSYNNVTNRPSGLSELQNLSVSNVSAVALAAENFDLSALNSVVIPTPEDGHALIYNADTQTWQSGFAGSSAGVSNLNGLTDVTITAATLNQLLQFNGTSWINQNLNLVLSAYQTSAQSNAAYVATSGGSYNAAYTLSSVDAKIITTEININGDIITSIPQVLNDITNVSAASPINGQVLTYSSSVSKWIPTDVSAASATAGTINHSNLTNLNANDHPQYVLSATNAALSSLATTNANSIANNATSIDFVTLVALNNVTDISNLSSLVNSNQTNIGTVSSNLESHTTDASIHFTAGSLSSTYSLSGHSHSYSVDDLTDTSATINVATAELGSLLGVVYDSDIGQNSISLISSSTLVNDGWTTLIVSADVTNSTTSNIIVSGLQFTPAANTIYIVEGYILVATDTIGTGAQIGISLPTGMTEHASWITSPNSNTEFASRFQGAESTQNVDVIAHATTDAYLARVQMLVAAGSSMSGDVAIVLKAEVASGTVRAKANSILRYKAVGTTYL